MTPRQAKNYLESFFNFEHYLKQASRTSFKLSRMKKILRALGDPQRSLKIVHIAGSKGKGSTSVMTATILKEAGYRVGLYTSPHIHDLRERIRVLDLLKGRTSSHQDIFPDEISDHELAFYVAKIKPVIERLSLSKKFGPLTFFEVFTALAIYYFFSQKVDVAILETGLGGRLDATNAARSIICAITPISFEHTNILGDTLEKIAKEKAAIIKDRCQKVVLAPQEASVKKVCHERCRKFGIQPIWVDQYFKCQLLTRTLAGQTFQLKSKTKNYGRLTLSLPGRHQLVNAAVSLGIIECLEGLSYHIPPGAVERGFKNVCWPGRFEIIRGKRTIVLDGAHNEASMKVLVETVKELFPRKKITLVLGISSDKDKRSIARQLNSLDAQFIVTKAEHPRASDFTENELSELFLHREVLKTANVREALRKARQFCPGKGFILVTGSLFVVSEARKLCINSKV